MASSKKKKTSTSSAPVDPSEFSDLGPVEPAPDDVKPKAKTMPKPEPKPEPRPEPPKEIVLSAKDVHTALMAGEVKNLPTQPDFEPKLTKKGNEIVLIGSATSVTAAVAGHAVDCDLVTEVRLVQWKVRGSADQLSGKYRLTNDIRMALGGKVLLLKAGKEFYGHQLDVEEVRAAGGVVIPLGAD